MGFTNLPDVKRFGRYTPILGNLLNCQTPTNLAGQWFAVGDLITVQVFANLDVTSAVSFALDVSLPFGFDVTDPNQVLGSCAAVLSGGFGGTVTGKVADDAARFEASSGATGLFDVTGIFSYIKPE